MYLTNIKQGTFCVVIERLKYERNQSNIGYLLCPGNRDDR